MIRRGERTANTRRTERGDTTLAAIVLVTALLVGGLTLVSAVERWDARRDATAAAASMARAGAQGDPVVLRSGTALIEPIAAQVRVAAIVEALNATGDDRHYRGRIVAIDGRTVAVEAELTVTYTYPVPGLASSVIATATAEATEGIGEEP